MGAIASLLSGHPASGFGVSDVVAAVTYAALFGPNMIVAVVALGFGSSISIGAQISTSGRALGPSVEYSLVEWQPHGPPAVAFALLLLPLLSTLVAGYRARDTTVARADLIAGLRWAAPAVSLALFVWAAIAEARIGGDLLGTRGFARLAPDPWVLAFVTILWTAGGVWLGWSIADRALRDRSPLGGTA